MAKSGYVLFRRSKEFEDIDLDVLKDFSDIDANGCWIWRGGKTSSGYGIYYAKNKTSRYVHRLSAELAYGEPGQGQVALHSCDVPSCCNPDHLRWGTATDNVADMINRNRRSYSNSARGERNGSSKLRKNDIPQIFLLRKGGWTLKQIADKYDVSITAIHYVLNGKNWKEA